MDVLNVFDRPTVPCPRMIMGLGGWMDGGEVSTGTIRHLVAALDAERCAEIDPLDFYVLNFPAAVASLAIVSDGEHAVVRAVNPMEHAATFRPHTRIRDGLVEHVSHHPGIFWHATAQGLLLFSAEEPHLRWGSYAETLLDFAEDCGVREIYFVGSVASPVPHTREPRVYCCYSSPELRERRSRPDINLSEYEGPASFTTYLLPLADRRGIDFQTIVVEIPHYPFLQIPIYAPAILRALDLLADLTGVQTDTTGLRELREKTMEGLKELMDENRDFRELVEKLERAYDREEDSEDIRILRRLIDNIDLGTSEN
jgi:predicted ATP-grasp superfamily ATP-dependent carboligase